MVCVEARKTRRRRWKIAFGFFEPHWKRSEIPAEIENLQGAITAYESGEIGYSKKYKYSLIWAGKVVDTCETFAEFASDCLEKAGSVRKGPWSALAMV
jgi:hypothetical protein